MKSNGCQWQICCLTIFPVWISNLTFISSDRIFNSPDLKISRYREGSGPQHNNSPSNYNLCCMITAMKQGTTYEMPRQPLRCFLLKTDLGKYIIDWLLMSFIEAPYGSKKKYGTRQTNQKTNLPIEAPGGA